MTLLWVCIRVIKKEADSVNVTLENLSAADIVENESLIVDDASKL